MGNTLMAPKDEADRLLAEANLICQEAEIKCILNKGVRICCPDCHSENYEFYPTGQLTNIVTRPEEDLHYVCKECGYIWNSEFLADRYQYRKSALTGQFYFKYQKKEKTWLWKILNWLGWLSK